MNIPPVPIWMHCVAVIFGVTIVLSAPVWMRTFDLPGVLLLIMTVSGIVDQLFTIVIKLQEQKSLVKITLKPANKIRREIICLAVKDDPVHTRKLALLPLQTDAEVEAAYEVFHELELGDYEGEFRSGQHETDIPAPYSRHYESESVAQQMTDGSWVGWTYWYGGGKHGEPEAIPWIEDAYDLECQEVVKTVVQRVFRKLPANGEAC